MRSNPIVACISRDHKAIYKKNHKIEIGIDWFSRGLHARLTVISQKSRERKQIIYLIIN